MLKKNLLMKVVCILALVSGAAPTIMVRAETGAQKTDFVQVEKLTSVIVTPEKHSILPATVSKLNELIEEYPQWVSSVNYYIDYVEAETNFTDEEFNAGLTDLIVAADEAEGMAIKEIDVAKVPEARNALNMGLWKLGIKACDAKGYELTSKLMTHAIKSGSSNPSTLTLNDNYGVFKVVALEKLATTMWEELTAWGATEVSYTKSHDFTFSTANSGYDYVMAIHACTVTFNWLKHEDGTYGCLAYLHDTFDFAAAPNDLSILGLANDVAVELTTEGEIGPFKFTINGTMG